MLRKRVVLIVTATLLILIVNGIFQGQSVPPQPKLLLVLSIDQMRFDYLTRFDELYKSGLRRLLDQGAVFVNAKYRHANSETGPGHSVILSGRHASHSGIVANSWYDPLLKRSINVVEDPVQSPVGGRGRQASPVNFIGFTVGDLLKLASPESKVVGVSQKDRSAILMTGRRADAAYWYENEGGNFITSSYYMKNAPEWLTHWNARKFVDEYAGKKWERLLSDTTLYEKYAGKDAVDGEWDRKDIVFPHSIRNSPPNREFYDDFRRTPFSDEMTLLVAEEAMKAHGLGQDTVTDLLAVGFSATDVIGHTYGPDSQEIMDQLLRLDQTLGKLFAYIENRVGLAQTWMVLSADHGSVPLVEVLRARGVEAKRVRASEIEAVAQRAVETDFPQASGLIANYDSPNFYLDESAIARCGIKRKAVEDVIVKALMATGYFESVYTQAQILDPELRGDPHLALIRNSFFQPRSPHLTVTPKPYIYISDNVGGTGHGTPHEYDRHVPIIFMGAPVKPGRYANACGPEDIAPTLARMLHLRGLEKESDARILEEMLRGNTE
jgi:predicted AlkP superfamily pyrophosphatase or phosphodiesterase